MSRLVGYIFTTEALNKSTRFLSPRRALNPSKLRLVWPPIADTDHALISDVEQLSSGEEFDGLIV
jgi:hypothetical protein